MKKNNPTGIVPENYMGKEIAADAFTSFHDSTQAHSFYTIASKRLLDVNNWHKIAGTLSAVFQLTDNKGNTVNRLACKGDYLEIDIPAPGNKSGNGYDWVLVEDMEVIDQRNVESIALRVRPTSNPRTEDKKIAHFYSKRSTSSFVLTRDGKKVTAAIYDRNIEPNSQTESATDNIRNSIVGLSAKYIFSKLQWQALAEALVKRDTI